MMCNIWNRPAGIDLSIGQWADVFNKNKQFLRKITKLDITGGEPFLYAGIAEFVAVCIHNMPSLNQVSITTNGSCSDCIVLAVGRMLQEIKDESIRLTVSVSCDGVGQLHDTIRGVPGIFENSIKTLVWLKDAQMSNPNLNVSVTTVIQQRNVLELDSIHRFIVDELKISDHLFVPLTFSENFQQNIAQKQNPSDVYLQTTTLFLEKMIRGTTASIYHKVVYADILRLMRGKTSMRRCPLLRRVLTIDNNGQVMPCFSSKGETFGTVIGKPMESIWKDPLRAKCLDRYAKNRCPRCNFVCGIGYLAIIRTLLTSPPELFRQIISFINSGR